MLSFLLLYHAVVVAAAGAAVFFVAFHFSDTQTLVNENNAAMPIIVKSTQQTDNADGPPSSPQPPQAISPMIMANPYDNKNERGKAFRQVLAAVIANLGMMFT